MRAREVVGAIPGKIEVVAEVVGRTKVEHQCQKAPSSIRWTPPELPIRASVKHDVGRRGARHCATYTISVSFDIRRESDKVHLHNKELLPDGILTTLPAVLAFPTMNTLR